MSKIIIYSFFLFILKIYVISNSCLSGYKHCSICNPITDLCHICDKEIYTPDKEGGCEYKKICIYGNNYCLECSKEENNLCIKCEEGYYPDEYGGCSYTKNCILSEKGKCLKCKEDYVLIGIENYANQGVKICKSIFSEDLKNCESIDKFNGYCIKCKEGYYVNKIDKKCSNTENCDESIFGVCIKCHYGYYLDKKDDKCKKQKDNLVNCKESINGEICDICEEEYYFDENGKCIFNNYCLVEKENRCEKCVSGYYLSESDFSCTKDPNCKLGDKNLGMCTTCKDNFYIDFKDGKCKSNQEDNDYKYCKTANEECYECDNFNYFIGEDHRCSSTKFCSESFNGTCFDCIDNYYLGLDNKCTNVKHCIYSDFYNECLECENDYYFDKSDKICKIGVGDLINCKVSYKEKTCSICKDDFYLNQSDYICYNNNEEGPFYKCAVKDLYSDNCIICRKDYYIGYIDNKCTKIEGCDISENENKCIQCREGYCLDMKTGKCEYNDYIDFEEKKFYYRCNRTNEEGTACEICIEGYKINENGLCIDDSLCEEKKDGLCQKCKKDEMNYCLNNYFGCIKIYTQNCLECNNILDIEVCSKCIEGYELDKYDRCIKKTN